MSLTFADIAAAQQRIEGAVYRTPCPESIALSQIAGFRVFCKLEYLQRTGSFKERGARNALELLPADQRRAGVIAASAGNHALGLAYHCQLMGIPAHVVMPRFAPLIKVTTCRHLGAHVELHGDSIDEARVRALETAKQHGLHYVHGFDDPGVIAGQGTMGLEILEQAPRLDAVIVPIGGGGLIAGVALAIKSQKPNVQIIGVEPEHAASFSAARAAGRPVPVKLGATLADGLAVGQVGDNAFALARERVDRVLLVNEDHLALAVLRLAELEKAVVEGAGAAGLAACLAGHLAELRGKQVVLPLCGGNIDPNTLGRVIDKGLVVDGRLNRFTAVISDRPGGLARFAALIASAEASVKEITHDRAFGGADINAVAVLCTVETRDHEHFEQLMAVLQAEGVTVRRQ